MIWDTNTKRTIHRNTPPYLQVRPKGSLAGSLGGNGDHVFRSRGDPSKKWRGRPSFLFPLLVFFLEGDRLARNVAYASDLLLCLGDQFPCGGIPSGVSLHL